MPTQLQAVASAVASRDPGQLERQAHKIKGAAGNLGALALQDAAHAIELACKGGSDVDSVQRLVPQLESQYQALKGRLGQVWPAISTPTAERGVS